MQFQKYASQRMDFTLSSKSRFPGPLGDIAFGFVRPAGGRRLRATIFSVICLVAHLQAMSRSSLVRRMLMRSLMRRVALGKSVHVSDAAREQQAELCCDAEGRAEKLGAWHPRLRFA
jgi:hypothetical protein